MPNRKYICDAMKEGKCDYRGQSCTRGMPHSHSRRYCNNSECTYSLKNIRIKCILVKTDIDILFDKLLYDFGEKGPQDKKPQTKKPGTSSSSGTSEGMWDTGIDTGVDTWTT